MTRLPGAVAFLVVAILLGHLGGMAIDPMTLHASAHGGAEQPARHHAAHGTVSVDDLAMTESARTCLEAEGIAAAPRLPLPAMPAADAPSLVIVPLRPADSWAPVRWAPPPVDASQLRAFLQVFLI